MIYIATVHRRDRQLDVLDDRGVPATTLELPESPARGHDVDAPLADAGWSRTAEWTPTDTGWQAPVQPQT